jgi:N-acetyl-anhydromuramyl-L-alanine amidase AmpD
MRPTPRPFLPALAALAFTACGEPEPPRSVATVTTSLGDIEPAAAYVTVKDCPEQAGKNTGKNWRDDCGDGEKEGPCVKYDPPLSNRCLAEAKRSAGVTVDYTYFGKVDCRSWTRKKTINKVVVHNGDDGEGNDSTWHCRKGASHYTIDRDGKIHQHVGEERAAAHASRNDMNDTSIGIELQIRRKYGTTCNSLSDGDADDIAAKYGLRREDVVAEMCSPTPAQYRSLNKLLSDIRSRYSIADVFGHCEVKGTTHGDPRAFDWRAIGAGSRKESNICEWYDVHGVTSSIASIESIEPGRTRVKLDKGEDDGLEVGDHGYLTDANEREISGRWFEIEKVSAKDATAVVSLFQDEVKSLSHAVVVVTPGKTPKPLSDGAKGAKPKLGSCETGEYGYYKDGKISAWTTNAAGKVDTLVLTELGWSQRVCDDATGMIYLGASNDSYVTDAKGTKIRFRMSSVGKTASNAKIIEGELDPATLGKNKRVVVRKRK